MLLHSEIATRIISPIPLPSPPMKKLLTSVSSAIASATFFAGNALALGNPNTIPGIAADEGTGGIKDAIVRVIVTILDFILIVAVVFVIIAGIRLIVSGGDEGEKDKAKTTILYVIAGIIVVLLARVIVTFVAHLL